MSDEQDIPLSMATFDQIVEELHRRSLGCVVACVIKMTDTEEHVYANWRGRTIALGLCARIEHRILNTPSDEISEDSG